MFKKSLLVMFLALLALAPDHAKAQTWSYSTSYNDACFAQNPFNICIDSITFEKVGGTSEYAGGTASITVHFRYYQAIPPTGPPTVSDFFVQLRYAYPGGQDTQVNLGAACSGEWACSYVLNLPSDYPSGVYTFKVQICTPVTLAPAQCHGGNQPPWDIEQFTVQACPAGMLTPGGRCCPADSLPMSNNVCCPTGQVPPLAAAAGNVICCPFGENVGLTMCCPSGSKQSGESCCPTNQLTQNNICCPAGQNAGATMCCPARRHEVNGVCELPTPEPPGRSLQVPMK
jgi:hypothetical protein